MRQSTESTNSGSATNDAVLAHVALFFRMFTKFYFGELSKDPPPLFVMNQVFSNEKKTLFQVHRAFQV